MYFSLSFDCCYNGSWCLYLIGSSKELLHSDSISFFGFCSWSLILILLSVRELAVSAFDFLFSILASAKYFLGCKLEFKEFEIFPAALNGSRLNIFGLNAAYCYHSFLYLGYIYIYLFIYLFIITLQNYNYFSHN